MTRASDTARLIGAGATINDGTTITTADNTTQLTLKSTDADGSSGPLLDLTRDSGSPADGDVTGIIRFRADNDAGEVTTTGQIVSLLNDASDGTEDGEMKLEVMSGGAAQSRIDIIPSETVFNEGSIDVDFRVESDGNANMLFVDGGNNAVVIGHNDATNGSFLSGGALQVVGTAATSAHLGISRFSDNAFPPSLFFAKSRSGSIGTDTVVQSGDELGQIGFAGADGTDLSTQGATIKAAVDGTPGGNDMPTRLVFSTTADGNSSVSERLRIDSSGNVGIGTTSPDGRADIAQDQNTTKFTSPHLALTATDTTNTTGFTGISYAASTLTNYGWTVGALRATSGSNSAFLFTQHNNSASGTERMRIDGTGRLFVNTSGAEPSSSQAGVRISGIDGENFFKSATTQTSGYDQLLFINGNGNVGSISTSGSATSYNTTSDYRLKENVVTDYDATTRLKQLKPSRFNFKADKDTTVDGFLAHEVSSIVPEAVTGTKDGVDTDGNPVYQGIDQSKLVPLLTKALQESIARADALEARIKKLEGS